MRLIATIDDAKTIDEILAGGLFFNPVCRHAEQAEALAGVVA